MRSTFPWYADVALLVGGYLAFALVRAAIDRGDPAATDHALGVQSLERKLGIAVEYSLNHTMLGHPVAIYLTGYFYRLCLLAVPVVLIWLRVRRPASYGRLRTVLVITTVLDLPLVLLFPESPPRFAQDGIVDYIARHDIVGGASLATPHSGVNLLAAMPSMHVAWTTWCAYATWSALDSRGQRGAWLVWLFPACTAFVVLATGHHYVLDIVAGVALVAIVARLTSLVGGRAPRAGHLRPGPPPTTTDPSKPYPAPLRLGTPGPGIG